MISVSCASTLVLIGGGERPRLALKYFIEHKKTGPIIVLPWGTENPQESFAIIKEEFENLGARDVLCHCRDGFSRSDYMLLESAGAVYFPGGDQNKIMQKIVRSQTEELLQKLFFQDVPFAGTSAGTAIQSNPMLTGNGFETAKGLGLLPGFLLDQHFLVRNREARLLGALEQNKNMHGMGIDESMSVAIKNNEVITAIGPSLVMLYLRNKVDMEIRKVELSNQMRCQKRSNDWECLRP